MGVSYRSNKALQRCVIDHSNPHSKGLIFCMHNGVDLVSGVPAQPVSPPFSSSRSMFEHGPYGRGLSSNNTTNGGFIFKNAYGLDLLAGKSGATFAILANVRSTVSFSGIIGIPWANTGWAEPYFSFALARGSTNTPRMAYSNSSGTFQSADLPALTNFYEAGNTILYGATRTPGGGARIHKGLVTNVGGAANTGVFASRLTDLSIFSRNSSATGEGANGVAYFACLWDRDLTASQWENFAADPFQVLRPVYDIARFYYEADPSTLLSVSDMLVGVSVGGVSLSQANMLAANDLGLLVGIDGVALSVSGELSVHHADISVSSDNVGLTQAGAIEVADSALSVVVEDVGLTQSSALSVAPLDMSVYIDSPALNQANILAVSDAALSAAIDSVVLIQANVISVADLLVSVSLDSVALSTADFLMVSGLSLASAMDAVSLLQANILALADLVLQPASDSIVLALNSVLNVADLSAAVAVDSVVLNQSNLLVVADVGVLVSADSPVLLQQNALAVNDARLSILMDSLTIGGGVFVTESALGMIIRDFQYVLLVEG